MKHRQIYRVGGVPLFLLLVALLAAPVSAQEGGFTETFDTPTLSGWEHSPNATVVGGVLRIEPNGIAVHPGGWGPQEFGLDVRREGEGDILVDFSSSAEAAYTLRLGMDFVALFRNRGEETEGLAFVQYSDYPSDDWFRVTIFYTGQQIEVLLNEQAVLSLAVEERLPPGGIVLRTEGDALAEFDNISIAPLEETSTEEQVEPLSPEVTSPEVSQVSGMPAYQSPSWTFLGGPPGGLGYDIRMQPDNPDIMYVTDANAGIHKSIDGGLTWFPTNQGILVKQDGVVPVFSATIDPHDYNTIWIGTQHGGHIYRSTDGGATWELRDAGVADEARSVRGITIDPNNPDIVYAGVEVASWGWAGEVITKRFDLTKGEVFKSTDRGETWTRIWLGNNLARYVWVDPTNSNRIYVSTGIFDRDAADSDFPNKVWGGVGILRSDDGGQTWEVLDERNGLGGRYVPSLFMHPDDPQTLLAGTCSSGEAPGAYVTRDGGNTWERVLSAPEGFGIAAVEISTSNTDIWYTASEAQIWRSDDAGVNWTHYMIGGVGWMPGMPIDLMVDPRDPYRIFVNNYGGGNLLSTDGGETWSDASNGYTGISLHAVQAAPGRSDVVLASNFLGTEGGMTWNGNPEIGMPYAIRQDPATEETQILTSLTNGDFMASNDDGQNWVRVSTVIDLPAEFQAGRLPRDGYESKALSIAPSNQNVVFLGYMMGSCLLGSMEACWEETPGPFKSSDGGYSWEVLDAANLPDTSFLGFAISPQDSQIVFAATSIGLYRTEDGGESWEAVDSLNEVVSYTQDFDTDLPMAEAGNPLVTDVLYDPFAPQVIYVASIPGAVHRSRDGGETWENISGGMDPNEPVYDLEPDRTRPGIIYASSSLSGVFVTTDGGETWQQIIEGLNFRNVRGLSLTDDGSVLYAATKGNGVYRLGTPSQGPEPGAPGAPAEAATAQAPAPSSGNPAGRLCRGALASVAVIPVILYAAALRRRA